MKGVFALLCVALILAGCVQTPPAVNSTNNTEVSVMAEKIVKNGDTVKVDYVGWEKDGKVFDTSIESEAKKAGLPARPSYEPLEFQVGAGQMIAGFDKAVVGMKVGEEKTVTLPPAEAYGERNEQMVLVIDAKNLSAQLGKIPKVGDTLQSSSGMSGKVTEVNANNVTIDFNHFLAGKTLVFKIIVRSIN